MSTKTATEVRSPTSTKTSTETATKTSTEAVTTGNVTVTGGAGDGATNVTIHLPPTSGARSSSMESYATKPMKFDFKTPEGATESTETEAPEPEESSEPMSPGEMGAAVKAAMDTGGDPLYQAICTIIDQHSKG